MIVTPVDRHEVQYKMNKGLLNVSVLRREQCYYVLQVTMLH